MKTTNIEELLDEMTLEEQVSLLTGADFWTTVPIPRLGVPSYLLMAYDTMRDIRLFHVCDLFLNQFNRQSVNGIFQMCDLCCSDDRRGNRFLL